MTVPVPAQRSLYAPAQFWLKKASLVLNDQLEAYIIDVRSNDQFSQLKGISDLARKMVETKKHIVYPLVCLLVTLALILPIATTTVERTFSTMNIVKN